MRHALALFLLLASVPAQANEAEAWKDKIHSRIDRLWAGSFLRDCQSLLQISHPLNNLQLVTAVRMRVADDGRLASVALETPSGVKDLDESALEVARAAAPMPTPPEAALSDDGYAHLVWAFPRDAKNGGPAKAKIDMVEWPAPKAVPALLSQGRWRTALKRLETHGQGDGAVDLGRLIAAAVLRVGLADKQARNATIHAIGVGRATALAPDLRLLLEGDPRLREAAIVATGRLRDRAAAPSLLRLLPKFDALSRLSADALAAIGDRAGAWGVVEPKITGRKALAALKTAAGIGEPSSVAKLSEILGGKAKPRVRAAAAVALGAAARGEVGAATSALHKALKDDAAAVREAAAAGIARAGREGAISKGLFYKVIPVLTEDPKPKVRAAALVAAGATGRDRASADVVLLSKKAKQTPMRVAATQSLALIPTLEARERLQKMTESDVPEVRLAALLALASRHEAEALAFVAAADVKGLKPAEDEGMVLASTAYLVSKSPVADFAKAVAAAPDATSRARIIGAWLAAESRR